MLNLLNREDFGQRHIDKVRISDAKARLIQLWNIGKRIVEQEMGGSERAEYGKGLISALAEDLAKEFGKNYSIRNLHYYIKFYQCFPDEQIVNACVHNLNWTHIRSLLRVADGKCTLLVYEGGH